MKIWTDGSGNGNFCYLREDGVSKIMRLPNLTNNQAEYWAIIRALRDARRISIRNVEIISDSQLIVNQLNHTYNINREPLTRLAQTVWKIAGTMGSVSYTRVPTRENLAGKLLG